MSLPQSMSYMVSRLPSVRRTPIRIVPDGSRSLSNNQQCLVSMPQNSLIDLSTLRMTGRLALDATPNADFSCNLFMPQSIQLCRRIEWETGGQIVAGNMNNNFDYVWTMLHKLNGSDQFEQSHLDTYRQTQVVNSAGKVASPYNATATGRRIVVDQFGGLQLCKNASAFDTSIFPNLRLRLQMEDTRNMIGYDNSGGENLNFNFTISDVEFEVETLQFVGNEGELYDRLVMALLQEGQMIQTSYPDYVTQISQADSAVRFNLVSQSVNTLFWCPLQNDYTSPTSTLSTAGVVADASGVYGPAAYKFRLLYTNNTVPDYDSTTELVKYNWSINGLNVPTYQATAQQGVENSVNVFCSHNPLETNLIWRGLYDDTGAYTKGRTYSKLNAFDSNCIIAHDLRSDPEATSAILSGLNTSGGTSQIILNTQNLYSSAFLFLCAEIQPVLSASADGSIMVQF